MKSIKKGFTLVEIIVCIILLMVIAGIFSINFIQNLNSNREREYKDAIEKLEASGDAYIMSIKASLSLEFEDYKLVMENDDTFTYITLEELEDNGFINDKSTINPSTGEYFEGVVKFSNKEGVYDFEYIENPKNLITVVYDKNGADSISRTAQAFICEEESLEECTKNMKLPSITRIEGRIFGWSTDPNAKTSKYIEGSSLSALIRESNLSIETPKIYIYAISSGKKTIYFDTANEDLGVPSELSCTVYNSEPSCDIELPNYTLSEYYEKLGWNTNINGTGDNYRTGSIFKVDRSITLYLSRRVNDFNILINKLKRVSSTNVIPANMNIIFVLDVSGSMSGSNRLANLKKVAIGLVDRLNLENTTISLISFNGSATTRLKFETDKLRIKSEINLLRASGGTSFTAAIRSTDALMNDVPNDKPSFVIFVSDGVSSMSPSNSNLISLKTKAEVYAMGIGATADNPNLQAISSKPENYYTYNDSGDDMTLTKFYSLFDDIVQNIMILEGDGLKNAIPATVHLGKLELGQLVISDKYPLDIFLNEVKIDSFTEENDYFYKEDKNYFFDVYNYSISKNGVGLTNMENLRIKFFYQEDK